MRKSVLLLALLPAVALAQSNAKAPAKAGPGGPGAVLDDSARLERMQKRVRLAATLGLAEALDLDEKGAMHVRDIFAHDTERRTPLMRQVRDNMKIVRDAARGDQAAAGQVDAALAKLRDARAQMQKLDDETFQQVTNGLSPDKKARAALFLARFRERGRHFAMGGGHGRGGWGPGHGPGMMGPGRGPGGPGMGPGMQRGPGPGGGPGIRGERDTWMMERQASNLSDPGGPELEDWMGDEE